MKLYCKIKMDGKWNWFVGDDPWKVATAKALCECRVCRPAEPNVVSQEKMKCSCGLSIEELAPAHCSNHECHMIREEE